MNGINYLAVVVAAVIALIASSLWYILFARQRADLSSAASGPTGTMRRPQPVKMLLEIARNLVLALALAYFIARLGVMGWTAGVLFGLIAWIGFPVVLLTGSVMWENVPWKLGAIHSGDWLIKLLLMSIVLAVWR